MKRYKIKKGRKKRPLNMSKIRSLFDYYFLSNLILTINNF